MAERLRRVEIKFHDPFSLPDASWLPREKILGITPAVCLLVGYVIEETNEHFVVAAMVHEEVDDVSMVSCVPKGCVVKLTELP